jgi:hypothetical protein
MSFLSSIKEKITKYIDVYIKLAKLSFIEGTADVVSYFIFAMIGLFLVFCVILFLGFGLTEAFVSMGLSHVASYFITLGVYVLLILIVFALRKNITRFFASEVVKVMTDDKEETREEE